MEPRTFGRFQVKGELGRGAYGVVLDAYDPVTDRPVALKILRQGELADFEHVERLRREAEALARVRHPNVVTVHETGARDGFHYMVLEHVEGRPLSEVMKELTVDRRLDCLEQAARGLHAAHVAGVVHRDVKPANILVDEGGRARLIDFGLVALAGASLQISQSGAFIGTPAYAAPEQARTDRAAIGPRTDIYALGAILFEMLTGELVYKDATAITSFVARLVSPAPSPRPRQRASGISHALDVVCARALEKDPARRFATAADFADALRAARKDHRDPRRQLLVLRALMGVAALLAIAVVAVLLRGHALPKAPPPPPPPPPRVKPGPETPREDPLKGAPAWFALLSADERPPLPLPRGLVFGARPGEYVNERDGSVLVFVPAGTSMMGTTDEDERERPLHEVELSGYFVGKLEISIAQFGSFVAATGYVTTAEKAGASTVLGDTGESVFKDACWRDPRGDRNPPGTDHPVSHVSWWDGNAYAAWAGLQLPSEAQWEKAAAWEPRTRKLRRFAWGDELANALSKKVGNVLDETFKRHWPSTLCFDGYDDGYEKTAPVGSFPDGASPFGALDMTGNVAEWCSDGYDANFYGRSPRRDPVCAEGTQRVIRGGCFSYGPKSCRAARRGAAVPERTGENLGLRMVLALP